MGDNEGGATFGDEFQLGLDRLLGLGVQRRSGLVKNQDGRVFQDGAGNRHALLFPAGELQAAFADTRLVLVGQGLDEIVNVRSASGFDVHRLEDGEPLWLGGVRIPHHQGLSGHSDADVALHAITDAVLGTIAAGDIGTHFPPSDPQWRGAESGQFLRHARALVEAKGGRITFVDLTLMCEAPKIGPHRAAMQARIAELLGLTTDRVSVKATTTERLGFTGRGEGIAAQAVATVTLPAGQAA